MDYNKLSQVTDSAKLGSKIIEKPSVEGLDFDDNRKSILDSIPVRKRVTDVKPATKVVNKVVFIDDAYISKVMQMSRAEKRAVLSKLTDAQRRRFLDRWSKIKDDSVEKLTLVNAATLLQNAAFSPTEYNRDLLKEFIDENRDSEVMAPVIQLGDWIINETIDPSSEEQKSVINSVITLFKDNGVQNSLREALIIPFEMSDSVEIEESVKSKIEKEAKDLAHKAESGELGLTDIINSTDDTLAEFVALGLDFSEVERVFNDAFNAEMGKSRQDRVKDSIIDKIAESDLLDEDGNPVDTEPQPTVLELLSEAIEEFANGDESKLKNLAQIEVKGATVSLEVEDKPEDSDGKEPEEGEEDLDEKIDLDLEEDEDLMDSVDLARSILKKDFSSVSRLVDKLSPRLNVVLKYPFKVVDFTIPEFVQVTQQSGVVNPPLTHDEYHSIRPEVPFVNKLAKQQSPCVVPPSATITPNEGYIDVSFNGQTQKWVPILGSVEDLHLNDQMTPEEIADKITNDCVPVYDSLKAAAFTDNLDLIDNRFYKKHLTDNFWSFDEVPSCLAECPSCEGCVVSQGVCGEVVGTLNIFGTNYNIVRL